MAEVETRKYHGLPVATLQVGQQLPFDVYESRDVLLLKRGTVITPKLLRHIQERRLRRLYVDLDELQKSTSNVPPPRDLPAVDFETDLTRELDEIDPEEFVVEGRALIESFRPRQPVAYDSEMVNHLIENRDNDVEELSTQLTELVEGSTGMPGRSIQKMTTTYIWHMAQDLDATLSVCQLPHKTDYLSSHSLQVSVMAMALAAELELPEDEVRVAGISGLIHDLGMACLPVELLNYPGRLELAQFLEIMKHPILSLDLVERVLGIPNRCRLIVYQVHERHNGKGYPRRRTGNKTYNIAKILGIVDAYLAMISDRPFRQPILPYAAVEQILKEARAGFWDPKITRAFISLIGLFPVGSFVMLNDDSLAKVMRSGGPNFGKPCVKITHNANGTPQQSDTVIDLAMEPADGLQIVQAIPPLFDVDASGNIVEN